MKNDFISNLFGYGPGCSGYAQSELMNFYPELDKWSIECDYVNQLWSYGYIGFAIYYYWYIKNTLSTFKLDTKYVAIFIMSKEKIDIFKINDITVFQRI